MPGPQPCRCHPFIFYIVGRGLDPSAAFRRRSPPRGVGDAAPLRRQSVRLLIAAHLPGGLGAGRPTSHFITVRRAGSLTPPQLSPKKQKTGPPHPAGRSVVQPDFITLDQRGLVQQKTLLAGGEAAVTRQKLALVIDGGGLVPQQIVNAHTKIIRDPPQRVIVRLTDALCVVAQRGRTKAQLGCKVFELDFLAIN